MPKGDPAGQFKPVVPWPHVEGVEVDLNSIRLKHGEGRKSQKNLHHQVCLSAKLLTPLGQCRIVATRIPYVCSAVCLYNLTDQQQMQIIVY